jgi:CheY-like chemotaxis protein
MELCHSILVADDNDDIRKTVVSLLRAKGYQAEGAKNGRDALQKLESLPVPSLVLLDLMMPVMSGWQFLAIQQHASQLSSHKIVMMSAVNNSLGETPIQVAGYIQKPFTFNNLLKKVQVFCGPPPKKSGVGHNYEAT